MNTEIKGDRVDGGDSPADEKRLLGKHADYRHGDHHKTATMATIAKAAGVSQGAISSLLNDRDYGIRVSEKTRERVFKVCRELGYMPNDLRAVVRMYPDLGDLCLLTSSDIGSILKEPFLARIADAAMKASSNPAHPISFAEFDPDIDYAVNGDLLPHPVRLGTASKFICLGTPNSSLFQALIKRGFPVVYLGWQVSAPGVLSIVPDYSEASRIAIEYLFGLGHRHIAILSGPFGTTDHQVIELNRGVKIGYDNIGIPIEAQNIIYGDLTFKSGFTSIDFLLDRNPGPTAVFCFNDAVAMGVLARLHDRGVKVPGDLSIMGCSDDDFSEYVRPLLTTIHMPAEEMGAMAVKEIERLVKEEPLQEAQKAVIPVRLVERESCSAPKS